MTTAPYPAGPGLPSDPQAGLRSADHDAAALLAADLLHLLLPGRRPVAVTRDLASFWATGRVYTRRDDPARSNGSTTPGPVPQVMWKRGTKLPWPFAGLKEHYSLCISNSKAGTPSETLGLCPDRVLASGSNVQYVPIRSQDRRESWGELARTRGG
jgi:hypothetical protein